MPDKVLIAHHSVAKAVLRVFLAAPLAVILALVLFSPTMTDQYGKTVGILVGQTSPMTFAIGWIMSIAFAAIILISVWNLLRAILYPEGIWIEGNALVLNRGSPIRLGEIVEVGTYTEPIGVVIRVPCIRCTLVSGRVIYWSTNYYEESREQIITRIKEHLAPGIPVEMQDRPLPPWPWQKDTAK